jgi:hypothetical protein
MEAFAVIFVICVSPISPPIQTKPVQDATNVAKLSGEGDMAGETLGYWPEFEKKRILT